MTGVLPRPRWVTPAASIAVVFGALTVASGGLALFGSAGMRARFGDSVPFVLWFNFLSGFAYVLAGVGIFLRKRWGGQLSALIALATLAIFVAFGWYVASGNAFEMRTVGALMLRSGVWIAIAVMSCRALGCARPPSRLLGWRR